MTWAEVIPNLKAAGFVKVRSGSEPLPVLERHVAQFIPRNLLALVLV